MALDWTIIFPAFVGCALTFLGACTAKLSKFLRPSLATGHAITFAALFTTIFFLIDSQGGEDVDYQAGNQDTPWYAYIGGLTIPFVVFAYALCIPVL
ncbi:hypothetical protein HDU98_004934, partial [Podochytrium sp. JEL0797]